MKNSLRPKIVSPKIDNIIDYYEALKQTIPLEADFLEIEQDFKSLLATGLANEVVCDFIKQPTRGFQPSSQILAMMRYKYVQDYGFSLLSQGLINELAQQLKEQHVVEVGAGTGFLASCLQKKGINIIPVDYKNISENEYNFKTSFTDITVSDAKTYLQQHSQPLSNTIMSWPPYCDDFASQILKTMKSGQRLYYCGEGTGGCTGDDLFFELLEQRTLLNEPLSLALQNQELQWHGLHDKWYVYDII